MYLNKLYVIVHVPLHNVKKRIYGQHLTLPCIPHSMVQLNNLFKSYCCQQGLTIYRIHSTYYLRYYIAASSICDVVSDYCEYRVQILALKVKQTTCTSQLSFTSLSSLSRQLTPPPIQKTLLAQARLVLEVWGSEYAESKVNTQAILETLIGDGS